MPHLEADPTTWTRSRSLSTASATDRLLPHAPAAISSAPSIAGDAACSSAPSGNRDVVAGTGVKEARSAGSRCPTQARLCCRTGISSTTPRALLSAASATERSTPAERGQARAATCALSALCGAGDGQARRPFRPGSRFGHAGDRDRGEPVVEPRQAAGSKRPDCARSREASGAASSGRKLWRAQAPMTAAARRIVKSPVARWERCHS